MRWVLGLFLLLLPLFFQNCSSGFQNMDLPSSVLVKSFQDASFQTYSQDIIDGTEVVKDLLTKDQVVRLPCGPTRLSHILLEKDTLIESGCQVGPSVVIAPQKDLANYNVFTSHSPIQIQIQGIVFDGLWTSGKKGAGEPIFEFEGSKSVSIKDCEFKNLAIYPQMVAENIWERRNTLVKILDAEEVVIEGSSVHDLYKYEVFTIKSRTKKTVAKVHNNTFYNLKAANSPVNAFNLKSIAITNNKVNGIKSSAFNVFSENATIAGNHLSDLETAGIDMHEGLYLSHGARIINNTIENCGLREKGSSSGIIVSGSNSLISGNTIKNCVVGIAVYNKLMDGLSDLGLTTQLESLNNILIEKNELIGNRVVNLRIQSAEGYPISAIIQNNEIGSMGHSTLWNIDLNGIGAVEILSNLLLGSGQSSLRARNDFHTLIINGNEFETTPGDLGHYIAFIGKSEDYTTGQYLRMNNNIFKTDLSERSFDLYSNGYLSVKKEFSGTGNIGADAYTKPFQYIMETQ